LTLEQTAHFADRRANLDDRLATVLAARRTRAASPLYPMLIAQVRNSSPRWATETLAPRRVPRSLYVLLAAIAVLIATSFYARPPEPPPHTATAQHGPSHANEESQVQPRREGSGTRAMIGDSPRDGDQANQASDANLTVKAAGDTGAANGSATESGLGAGSRSGSGTRSDDRAGADAGPDAAAQVASLSDRMQESIRDALGASSGDRDRPDVDPDSDSDRSDAHGSPRVPSASEAPGLPDERLKRPKPRNQPDADQAPPDAGGGHGAPSGGTGASATVGGLFDGQPVPNQASGNPQALAVKLGAHTALAPSQHEPQRQSPRVDAQGQRAVPANDASHALVDEHLPVAALQKPNVAAEHEAIVRRIFTRDE
jgi:hypothetical protein